ncbi:DAK2 domain-containing protein [Rothia sp. P7181]|uniref:DAK2 domain-containing protein n=1 Tax=unclassified Rothia (in: high G+C Gram-positive bacteria) TaxID=2689056 RepID=UPI003ADCC3F8
MSAMKNTLNVMSVWPQWCQESTQILSRYCQQLNDINFFPVPDSDTGSNLLATCRTLCEHLHNGCDPTHATQETLRTSRGNSGTLLSAWFNALTRSLGNDGELTPEALHLGLFIAQEHAHATMIEPAEATMLTVMSDIARAPIATSHIEEHVFFLAECAYQSAASTRHVHGSADAGAVGLFLVINALSSVLNGKSIDETTTNDLFQIPAELLGEPDTPSDELRELLCEIALPLEKMMFLRSQLEVSGQSLAIAMIDQTEHIPHWRIHIHVKDPQQVKELLEQYGTVENLEILAL